MSNFTIADPPHEPADISADVLEFDLTLAPKDLLAGARFCNFPTGKESLRSPYVKWVTDNVDPLLKPGQNRSFEIRGLASRLGSANANTALSHRRMSAVQALLESRAKAKQANVIFKKTDADGESEAEGFGFKDGDNSGRFRAVEVLFFGTKEPPPVFKPPRFKRQAGSRKFHMAFLSGISVSAGPFQADALFFIIVSTDDVGKNTAARYSYAGKGFTVPTPIPFSISDAGFFTPFRTTVPILLPTLEGPANVVQPKQITVGKSSLNSFVNVSFASPNLAKTKARVFLHPVSVETGSGFGVTLGSITEGQLKIVGTTFPFTAPIVLAGSL